MARRKEFAPVEALDQAMELFWRRGYQATSLHDLVDHLGINRQSLYDTFGDKHELFLATLDRYFDVSIAEHFRILNEPGPALGAMRRFCQSLVELTGTDAAKKGCMVVNSAVELALHDEDARARVAAGFWRMATSTACAVTVSSVACRQTPATGCGRRCKRQEQRVTKETAGPRHSSSRTATGSSCSTTRGS